MIIIDTQKIGRFIAMKRKEKKLTQAQFGELLGVANKTVSKWENGVYMPDLSLLVPISEVLEVSLNELLAGEHLSKEEMAETMEETITTAIYCSKEEVKKIRKKYTFYLVLIMAGFIGIIMLLNGFLFRQVSYTNGNTQQWEGYFLKHSAYELGIDENEKPVFLEPNMAIKKAESDYSDIILYMRECYGLLPFSKYTYSFYLPYLDKIVTADERLNVQLEGLQHFVEIYENSFQRKHKNGIQGGSDMEQMMLGVMIFCFGVIFAVCSICTKGMDVMGYFFYKGRAKGSIEKEEAYSASRSIRSVEKKNGETYERILSTEDRSVHYMPYSYFFAYPFHYYGKTQAIITWTAGEGCYKARYPYFRKRGDWKIGEEVEVRYSLKHPWKYAISDGQMWGKFCLEMMIGVCLCIIGMIVLMGS